MRWFVGLCAGAVLALSVSGIGCGSSYQAPPVSGGSKGPGMKVTASTGKAISASASSMAPRPAPFAAPPSPAIGESADAGNDQ